MARRTGAEHRARRRGWGRLSLTSTSVDGTYRTPASYAVVVADVCYTPPRPSPSPSKEGAPVYRRRRRRYASRAGGQARRLRLPFMPSSPASTVHIDSPRAASDASAFPWANHASQPPTASRRAPPSLNAVESTRAARTPPSLDVVEKFPGSTLTVWNESWRTASSACPERREIYETYLEPAARSRTSSGRRLRPCACGVPSLHT